MEFFLIVPLVLVVLVAGLHVVSVARIRIELLGAVREGARVAATHPDPSRAVEAVVGALAPEMAERARVSVTRPSVPGRIARVSASLPHTIDLLVWSDLRVEVSASASMMTEK